MLGPSRDSLRQAGLTVVPLTLLLTLSVVAHSTVLPDDAADQLPPRLLDPNTFPVREVPIPPPEGLGPETPAADAGLPTGPPENPQVGDSWLWWLFYHEPMPPHFEQRTCTVRGKSNRGYVVVEDSQWGINISQGDVDIILERWESSSLGLHPDMGIYQIDSLYFGAPPDELDEDPRVYLMWFDIGSFGDGFFFWFDQYPDGTYAGYRSNECETVYLNSAGGHSPSSDYMISVAAHELEHMIHWKYDDDEDAWVDEGMAELAMWFYGRPDDISSFNLNPDNPLTQWDGNWADYIQTYLWSLYFYERYGGGEAVRAIVDESLNSINGYEAVLDSFGYTECFADVFADWAVANFLDDPTISDGRFGYLGDDLPPFSVVESYAAYPVPDQERAVSHWATDYYRFENLGGISALELGFDGSDGNVFAVWALALGADGTPDVVRVQLDGTTQSGALTVPGLGHPDNEVILVVAGTSSVGSTRYTFSANAGQLDAPGGKPVAVEEVMTNPLSLTAFPNPSSGEVLLQVDCVMAPGGVLNVNIYNALGHVVQRLTADNPASRTVLSWDRRDTTGRLVPAGLYHARAATGRYSSGFEAIVLR